MKVLVKTRDSVEVRKVKNIDDPFLIYYKKEGCTLTVREIPNTNGLYCAWLAAKDYRIFHTKTSVRMSVTVAPLLVFVRLRRNLPLIGKKFSWLDFHNPSNKDIEYVKNLNLNECLDFAVNKEIESIENISNKIGKNFSDIATRSPFYVEADK